MLPSAKDGAGAGDVSSLGTGACDWSGERDFRNSAKLGYNLSSG